MYPIGTVSPRLPQFAGAQVLLTDSRDFVLRRANNEVTPLTREQVLAIIQAGTVDWDTPERPQQVVDMLAALVRAEREAAQAATDNATQQSSIQAAGELDALRNLVRGRTILLGILSGVILLSLGLATWAYLDKPAPPKKAAKQVAEGKVWVTEADTPELGTSGYIASGEVGIRLTGFFVDTESMAPGTSSKIRENLMLSPLTSSIPMLLRPLDFQKTRYRQMPVVVDDELGNFAIYADNPEVSDPDFQNLWYVETASMRIRPLVAAEKVLSNRSKTQSEGSIEAWDTIGGYDIDDHRVILEGIQNARDPMRRTSVLLWYNTAGLEGTGFDQESKPVLVDQGVTAADGFKDDPMVSRDPGKDGGSGGQGYWLAYSLQSNNLASTETGRVRVIHAFDDSAISRPTAENSFYVNQLMGRPAGASETQSTPDLLGNRLLFVEGGKAFVANLGTVESKGEGKPNRRGTYDSYSISVQKPKRISDAGTLAPKLLRDYNKAYYVIVVDGKQRILAYPAEGGEPIVVSESKGKKTALTTFRSHVMWLEEGAKGVELRENAVFPAQSAVVN